MKKKGDISTEKLVGLILLLAFLVIAVGIIYLVYDEVDSTKMGQFSCWMTNGLKSSNVLFKQIMPSTCSLATVEEKASLEDITKMLTDTWWMYHQGDIDTGWSASDVTVFQFINKEEVTYETLVQRLIDYKGETKVTDLKDSDFNYLQEGSEGSTLCLGNPIKEDGWKLKKDQKYFIIYFDSNRIVKVGDLKDFGDKVAITTKPNIKQETALICPSYADLTEGIAISKSIVGEMFEVKKT